MSSSHLVFRMLVPDGGFTALHFENMTQASLLSKLLIVGEGSVFDQCIQMSVMGFACEFVLIFSSQMLNR